MFCSPTSQSYHCKCNKGFILEADKEIQPGYKCAGKFYNFLIKIKIWMNVLADNIIATEMRIVKILLAVFLALVNPDTLETELIVKVFFIIILNF